nr:hypothetical protein GCM10020093_026720 [Planobispora longispora]
MRNTLGGLRPWLRDHPLITDAVLAMLLTAVAVLFAHGAEPAGARPGRTTPPGRRWP